MGEAKRRKALDHSYGFKTVIDSAKEILERMQKTKPENYYYDFGLIAASQIGIEKFDCRLARGHYGIVIHQYEQGTGISLKVCGANLNGCLSSQYKMLTLEYPWDYEEEVLDLILDLLMTESLEMFVDWNNRYTTNKKSGFSEVVVPVRFTEKSLQRILTAVETGNYETLNLPTKKIYTSNPKIVFQKN